MPKPAPFVLTEQMQQALDNLPAPEPRSKLEPLRAYILRWRREGRSYRNIQSILASQCGVNVSYETLRRFVKLRSRPRKVQPEIEAPSPAIAPEPGRPDPRAAPRQFAQLSQEQQDRQRALLKALREKPIVTAEPSRKERFEYDPDKPLIIDRSIKE